MNIMKQQGTTLVQRACAKVNGFKALHKMLEKKLVFSGRSMSTLYNYMRCIAHLCFKYDCLPTKLDIEQLEGNSLHLLRYCATRASCSVLRTTRSIIY